MTTQNRNEPSAGAEVLRAASGLGPEEHWSELLPDAMVGLDGRKRVLFCNRAAREMFCGNDPVTVGAPPLQCTPLLTLLEELQLDAMARSGEPAGSRKTVRRIEWGKDENRVQLEVSVAAFWKNEDRLFVLAIRRQTGDGPDRREMYQSQKAQLIGALAGGIAHDFNNILTAVIGHLELAMSNKDLPEAVRESLRLSVNSARRGAELNTKLLEFSRHKEARPALVNVPDLINKTTFILRRSIDPRVRMELVTPPEKPWLVRVDEGQLMQSLMNLSLNARDAMPKGGQLSFLVANCKFAADEIKVSRLPGEFVRITVRDTGQGMPAEVLGRLFEPYFTTKEFGKGAGLGLSIANHLMVEQGGWMEVESVQGQGSSFHIFLPRASTESAPAGVAAELNPAAGRAVEGNETILLVDDEQSVRTVVQAMLSYRGYKVIEAVDGQRGIEQFRAHREKIGLVMLDLVMPSMNGWDAMQKIRELDPGARIILMSGGVADVPEHKAELSSVSGVLNKPFASTELLYAVRKALDTPRRAA